MTRWFLMLLTCLTLALGPSVNGIVAACQPVPVASESGCGDECCCGDETQCPCVHRAPEHSDPTPTTPRPTTDARPLLLPGPGDAAPMIVVAIGGDPHHGAVRVPLASKVRSQALLCRWRT
ncbi:MAG: hypothetical protein K2Y21_11910 [Phycisphaerales bacterium]|nr:hypothetical protein [Phycisphaerales bacterium]